MVRKISRVRKTLIVLSVVKIIFVLALFLSLTLWSIPIISLNSNLWSVFQDRSGVVLNNTATKSYNDLIIDFFTNNTKLNFLNERELNHLEAVRNLITVMSGVALFSFIYVIGNIAYPSKFSKEQKKFLLNAIQKTSLVVFIITLIFSIIVLTNFYTTFIYFHKLFFVSNFAFPSNSLLKILYPDDFFFQLSGVYLLSIMITSLIVAVVSRKLKLK